MYWRLIILFLIVKKILADDNYEKSYENDKEIINITIPACPTIPPCPTIPACPTCPNIPIQEIINCISSCEITVSEQTDNSTTITCSITSSIGDNSCNNMVPASLNTLGKLKTINKN